MTIQQIATTTESGTAVQIRYRKGSVLKENGGVAHYDVKPLFNGKSRGWTVLDASSIRALAIVFGATRPDLHPKMNNLPLATLMPIVWKTVSF
jgi:hypothetical protein